MGPQLPGTLIEKDQGVKMEFLNWICCPKWAHRDGNVLGTHISAVAKEQRGSPVLNTDRNASLWNAGLTSEATKEDRRCLESINACL